MSETPELTVPLGTIIELIRPVFGHSSSVKIEAKGRSMFPFIRDGDVVTLSDLSDASPRVGDVVAVRIPGSDRLAFHRVVARLKNRYLVKGDNCEEPDGVLSRGDILGRISGVERNGAPVYCGFGLESGVVAILSRLNLLVKVWSLSRDSHVGRECMWVRASARTRHKD